jgi:seryl-tRNA synthetase
MKPFTIETRFKARQEMMSFQKLVIELDAEITAISKSISVSKDSWRETQEAINKMRSLTDERNGYEKKIKKLNQELTETI